MMKSPRILSMLVLLGLVFAGSAMAQLEPQASQDNPAQMMRIYQKKALELMQIQQKTLRNNPKLAAEMKHFEAEMAAGMRTHGYDAVKGRKSVQAMVARLKSGKNTSGKVMSQAERLSIMKSYRDEVQRMMKARAVTLRDPKIRKDRKVLNDHLMVAMKKQDSHAAQLLKEVKALRAKILSYMAAHRMVPKQG